jgi:hypothetical protein
LNFFSFCFIITHDEARSMWWSDYCSWYLGDGSRQTFCCSFWILLNVIGLIIPKIATKVTLL